MALEDTTILQLIINGSKPQKLRGKVRYYFNRSLTTLTAASGCIRVGSTWVDLWDSKPLKCLSDWIRTSSSSNRSASEWVFQGNFANSGKTWVRRIGKWIGVVYNICATKQTRELLRNSVRKRCKGWGGFLVLLLFFCSIVISLEKPEKFTKMNSRGCFQAVVLDAGGRLWKTPSQFVLESTVWLSSHEWFHLEKNSKEWTKNTAGGEGNMITVRNWNNKETRLFFFFR